MHRGGLRRLVHGRIQLPSRPVEDAHRLCRRLFPRQRRLLLECHERSIDRALRCGRKGVQRTMPTMIIRMSLLILLAMTSSCVRRYRPPSPSEPHAVVKLRRVYETHAGTQLRELVMVGKERGFERQAAAEETTGPANDAILVHPTPDTFRIEASFHHVESRPVQEQYFEREPYQEMEQQECGTYQSPRKCSRMVTKYRSHMKWRTVVKTVEVADGNCGQNVPLAPVAGHTYLLQFTYHGPSQCHLTCFEQVSAGTGINQRPCPAALVPAR